MTDQNFGTTFRVQNSLDRLAQGDISARDELFSHARRRLVALTHWMMRDFSRLRRWEDTDDVLQQSLVRMCRAIESAQPLTTPDFFRVAALQIRRELRDLARRHFGPNGWGTRLVSDGPNGMGVDGYHRESQHVPSQLADWAEFHSIVEQLPDPERQAFELVWYNELTRIEAATVMGISERQLRRYWTAARIRLQREMPGFFNEK